MEGILNGTDPFVSQQLSFGHSPKVGSTQDDWQYFIDPSFQSQFHNGTTAPVASGSAAPAQRSSKKGKKSKKDREPRPIVQEVDELDFGDEETRLALDAAAAAAVGNAVTEYPLQATSDNQQQQGSGKKKHKSKKDKAKSRAIDPLLLDQSGDHDVLVPATLEHAQSIDPGVSDPPTSQKRKQPTTSTPTQPTNPAKRTKAADMWTVPRPNQPKASTAARKPNAGASARASTAARQKSRGNQVSSSMIDGGAGEREKMTDEELRQSFLAPGAMDMYLSQKWLSTAELGRLEKDGVLRYKKGRFSQAEDEAIRNHFRELQRGRMSDLELGELIMAKGKNEEYPRLWNDAATALPGRPVRFVQRYIKRIYDPRKGKGTWTEEECRLLKETYAKYPNQWLKIAEAVDRPNEDCRAKWRDDFQYEATSFDTGKWRDDEIAKLIEVTKAANLAVGNDELARNAPWEVVGMKMEGTRTQPQCRKKWQEHLQPRLQEERIQSHSSNPDSHLPSGSTIIGGIDGLKNKAPEILTRADRYRLIQSIREGNFSDHNEISWKKLAKRHFPTYTGDQLRWTFRRMRDSAIRWRKQLDPAKLSWNVEAETFSDLLNKMEANLLKRAKGLNPLELDDNDRRAYKTPDQVPDDVMLEDEPDDDEEAEEDDGDEVEDELEGEDRK